MSLRARRACKCLQRKCLLAKCPVQVSRGRRTLKLRNAHQHNRFTENRELDHCAALSRRRRCVLVRSKGGRRLGPKTG